MRFSDTELAEFFNLRQATFLLVLGLLSKVTRTFISVRSKILSSFDKMCINKIYYLQVPTGLGRTTPAVYTAWKIPKHS